MIYPFERQRENHIACEVDEEFLNSLSEEDRQDFVSIAVVQTTDVFNRYKQEVLSGALKADPSFLESEFRTKYYGFSFDPDEHAETFLHPIAINTGKQDAAVGYKDAMSIAVRYPNATFSVLDYARHLVQIEQPVIVEILTKEWLRRCQLSTPSWNEV